MGLAIAKQHVSKKFRTHVHMEFFRCSIDTHDDDMYTSFPTQFHYYYAYLIHANPFLRAKKDLPSIVLMTFR